MSGAVLRRDTISESLPGKTAELFEEIGVETDEDAGVELKAAADLMKPVGASFSGLGNGTTSNNKRRRASRI